jgi:pimeloyl-ACP methyl ester carboxylesterase
VQERADSPVRATISKEERRKADEYPQGSWCAVVLRGERLRPLLILILGASGTGEAFRLLTHHLTLHYQVVTYDRRGFSRSSLDGPQDYVHRLATDADDVRRLIEHLTDQPAIVFGSSSGTIVALEVLTHAPMLVQTLVANAPPAVLLLPNAASWLAFFDGVYETYRKEGLLKPCTSLRAGYLEASTSKCWSV